MKLEFEVNTNKPIYGPVPLEIALDFVRKYFQISNSSVTHDFMKSFNNFVFHHHHATVMILGFQFHTGSSLFTYTHIVSFNHVMRQYYFSVEIMR